MRFALSIAFCLALLPVGASAQVVDGLGNANTYVIGEAINNIIATNPIYNTYAYCSPPGLALSPLGGPFVNFGTERDTGSFVDNHEEIGETDIGYTAGQYLEGLNYSGVYAHNEEDLNPGDMVDFYPLSSISQTAGHALNIGVEGNNAYLLDIYIDGEEYVTGLPQVGTAGGMDTFLGSAMDVDEDVHGINETVQAPEFNIFTNGSYCDAMSTLAPNATSYASWPAPGSPDNTLVNLKNDPTIQSSAAGTYADTGTPLMEVSIGTVPSVPSLPTVPEVSALAYRYVAVPTIYKSDPAYTLKARRQMASMERSINQVRTWYGAKVSVASYGEAITSIGRQMRRDVSALRTVYVARRPLSPNFRLGLDKFKSGSFVMIFDCETGQLLEAHISGIHS